jgi:cytoskeletal protein CcmA (bactofilin family)
MMFARDKDTKWKSDESGRQANAPVSEMTFPNLTPPAPPERAPAIVSRATPNSSASPHPASAPAATPASVAARDSRNEPKPEAKAEPREEKKLIVGRGISLDGKISSCDRLIIDGKVQAELEDCHTVEVTENGTFKGAAEITGADISGHYDGSLTVRENLMIRGTGRVSGTVRYGRLHIEDGGEINGDVKSMNAKSN